MANDVLRCIMGRNVTSRSSKLTLPLSSALRRLHLAYRINFWLTHYRRGIELLERVKMKMKMIK